MDLGILDATRQFRGASGLVRRSLAFAVADRGSSLNEVPFWCPFCKRVPYYFGDPKSGP